MHGIQNLRERHAATRVSRAMPWGCKVLAAVSTLLVVACANRPALLRSAAASGDADAPATIATASSEATCPVSRGSRDLVPNDPQIFGAGGYWFGDGPAYLTLSWKDWDEPAARFGLSFRQLEAGLYRVKTPLVVRPDFKGRVTVRGYALSDAERAPILISVGGYSSRGPIALTAATAVLDTSWPFWASGLFLPGPGCYAIEFGIEGRTSRPLVFEALPMTENR